MLHGSFLLFNCAHFGHARTSIKQRREPIELFGVADGVDLHAPVVFVAHPAAQAEFVRALLDEPAESDTLYPAGNKPPAGLDQ